MITATSMDHGHVTQLTNGRGHYIFADNDATGGGTDLYQRPGELLAEAYAACTNITARMLLEEAGYPDAKVVTRVEMDRDDPDKLTFYTRTDISGEVPEEVKAEVLERITRCPVCRMLRAEKEFLPLGD